MEIGTADIFERADIGAAVHQEDLVVFFSFEVGQLDFEGVADGEGASAVVEALDGFGAEEVGEGARVVDRDLLGFVNDAALVLDGGGRLLGEVEVDGGGWEVA